MEPRSSARDLALLVFRVVLAGSMLIAHGYKKVMRVFGSEEITFGDPIGLGQELSLYLAAFAEGFCALLIIVGLFTRLAAIPLIITMAVIIFFVKLGDPFGEMELPLLYLVGFLLILTFGAGRYSLDGYRKKLW